MALAIYLFLLCFVFVSLGFTSSRLLLGWFLAGSSPSLISASSWIPGWTPSTASGIGLCFPSYALFLVSFVLSVALPPGWVLVLGFSVLKFFVVMVFVLFLWLRRCFRVGGSLRGWFCLADSFSCVGFCVPSSMGVAFFNYNFVLFAPSSFVSSLSVSRPGSGVVMTSADVNGLIPRGASAFKCSGIGSLLALGNIPPAGSIGACVFLSISFVGRFVSSFGSSKSLSSMGSANFAGSGLPAVGSGLILEPRTGLP